MSNSNVCLLGGGFIGKPLAQNLKTKGYNVSVVVRSDKSIEYFKNLGVSCHSAEIGSDTKLDLLIPPNILIIVYPIGSRSAQGKSYLEQVQWIMRNFPARTIDQVILTSSTSVYPDGFGLVDEAFCEFSNNHKPIQLLYENELRSLYEEKLVILRLAGLVGEERHPGRFLAGRENLPNPHSPVNMIHQSDVLRFIETAVENQIKNEVLNLCYDEHPSRLEYYTKASISLGLTPPKFSMEQIDNPKIIDNKKAKKLFQMEFTNSIRF